MGIKSTGVNKWQLDYRLPNGRRRRETVMGSKSFAKDALAKKRVEISEGKHLDKKDKKRIKFEDFAKQYCDIYCSRLKSYTKYHAVQLKNLDKHFNGKYLHDITIKDIELFKSKRLTEVKPASVNRSLACLKSLFNKAIAWGDFKGENPVKQVKKETENNTIVRYLDNIERAKLLAYCTGYLKTAVIIALNTGMRKGEILNLKWEDIDFEQKIIYIPEPKAGKRQEVPMNLQVKEALISHGRHTQSDYVFFKKDGLPLLDIKKCFWTALKKCDINNFRFHDLRHTFASYLVMGGVPLNTVRELMRHASMDQTIRYAHLSSGHKKDAVERLGQNMDTFWTLPEDMESSEKNDSHNVLK